MWIYFERKRAKCGVRRIVGNSMIMLMTVCTCRI